MGIWLCAYCTEQARDHGALGAEVGADRKPGMEKRIWAWLDEGG